jgi:para-aminobenzoate synthetase component I
MKKWVTQLPEVASVWQETIDLPAPFEQFAARFSRLPGTVVLLSGLDIDCARYHILGIDPWLRVIAKGRRIDVFCRQQHWRVEEDPLVFLQTLQDRFHLKEMPSGTLPVSAGFMGYLAYDLKDMIEDLPRTCIDPGLPDIWLAAPSMILVQDRRSGITTLSVPVLENNGTTRSPSEVVRQLKQILQDAAPPEDTDFSMDSRGLVSGFEKQQYLRAVKKIIQYLKSGDIYQANLAQRFEAGFSGDAYAFFQQLFARNPAPFFAFVQAGDHQIVSTSPERFLLQQGTRVETRPIKGTIARGVPPDKTGKTGKSFAAVSRTKRNSP